MEWIIYLVNIIITVYIRYSLHVVSLTRVGQRTKLLKCSKCQIKERQCAVFTFNFRKCWSIH